MDAGAGADIDDVVGGHNRVLVVLDDDDGVAEVAQVLERAEQAVVVALVQADGGLIQHVEHAGEAGADLRGEADALAFAAGQRARGAGHGEVIEADIDEELQTVADLLQDAGRDFGLLFCEGLRQVLEPDVGCADRHFRDFADVLAADLDRERLRFQAIAVAGFARMGGLVAREFFADPLAVGFLPAARDVADHAFEGFVRFIIPRAVPVRVFDFLVARAEQDRELHVLGQLLPRCFHRNFVVLGEAFERLLVVGRGRAGFCPWIDGAFLQREGAVGDDEFGFELQFRAEAVALRAGAGGRVEGEQARFDFLDGEAGDRAGEAFGEHDALVRVIFGFVGAFGIGFAERLIDILCDGETIGELEGLFERVRQARGDVGAHDDAIDDHVDVVLELLVELGRVADLGDLAVDLDALEALLLPLGQFLAVLAFATAHDRCEDHEARAFWKLHHAIDHLRNGLAFDGQAGRGRIRDADAGEEQAQVIVDLGDGADGGARVLRRCLLLDGDGGREAVDVIDIGLLHHLEELARVRRQAFDVAALALGVDGIEGERGFARARQSREHDKRVARDFEIDVLQIVLARAADVNGLVRFGGLAGGGGFRGLAHHRFVARGKRALQCGGWPVIRCMWV